MIHDVGKINKLLKENFGDDYTGNPLYRVVWADDQLEKQLGEFEEFYGQIFIRKFVGLKEIKKYMFIKERWILEKLMVNPVPDIIVNARQSYECIYIFQGPGGIFLPAAYEVAAALIRTFQHGRLRTESERKDEDDIAFMQEVEQMHDYLAEDGPSDLSINNRLHGGVFLNNRGNNVIDTA